MESQGRDCGVFRESYGDIGMIRSSLGCDVPCLAMTATATKKTRQEICENLGMFEPRLVLTDVNEPNIRYSVLKVDDNHTKNFKWLVDKVASQGINTERHIIFCHRVNDMTGLFRLFSACLGDKQYVSLTNNLPNDCNRLFAMYHQKTDPDIQETVRKSFGTIDGVVRVLFCTIAFGMGVDVKGVHNVIHYGPARDIDDYLQESGRAGRNPDVQSHALLLNVKGSSRGSHISTGMRQYIKDNTKCKRVQLLDEFQNSPRPLAVLHNCCSFCANKCKCHCACTVYFCLFL